MKRWHILPLLLAGLAAMTISLDRKSASYAGAFTDWDGYVLAIGADLRVYRRLTGMRDLPMSRDMSEAAYRMHQLAVVHRGKGWLFQPGAYTDHRDFAFAGHSTKSGTVTESRVPGIAWDSSHFSRWPLWLTSFELADRPAYYRSLRNGLARQFEQVVLVPPGPQFRTYRLTNYMDGRNGLFRWNGLAKESYGPYQLSGTFVYGWWTALDTPGIRTAYAHLSENLPFSPSEYDAFFGPFNWMSNAQASHLARLAALPADAQPTPEDLAFWRVYEAPLLKQSPCSNGGGPRGSRVQDAQYELMMPMHVAFRHNIPAWKAAFAAHFAQLSDCDTAKLPRLDELHYLYFVTRFMVLAAQAGQAELVPDAVRQTVERRLSALWTGQSEVISNEGWGEPRFGDFRSYLEWKFKFNYNKRYE